MTEKCDKNLMNLHYDIHEEIRKKIYYEAVKLVHLLKDNNYHISFAESLTAGMISAALCDVNGASNVFEEGYVTYSDFVKEKVLGVDKNIIEKYGVVSSETASCMCEKLKEKTNSELCISVTGYAGPKVEDEPVGLVFIGLLTPDGTKVLKCEFEGDRQEIRLKTCFEAFRMSCIYLNNMEV